jgi:hypothetical protein
VPAHALLLIRDFLADANTTVLPQPPYSPDLALADFSSFGYFTYNNFLEENGNPFNDPRDLFKEETMWVCSVLKLIKSSFLFMSYSEHDETTVSFPKLLTKFATAFLCLSWILCHF